MLSLSNLRAALAPAGLNAVGVADPAAWDARMGPERVTGALLPGARAIIVVGNGGPTLWRAFVAALEADPGRLTREKNPIDAFVRREVLRADEALGDAPRRWFWAAADAETHIDFRVLAHLAGLGAASRLGLLLHDRWGPWLGLRAACFVDLALPFDRPQTATGLELSAHCRDCHACEVACPGAAFPGGTWAVDACSTFHHTSTACASTCHSRAACPVGAKDRYDPDEFAYHSNRRLGRQALRAHLGVRDGADRFEGEGPFWRDWRTRTDVSGG